MISESYGECQYVVGEEGKVGPKGEPGVSGDGLKGEDGQKGQMGERGKHCHLPWAELSESCTHSCSLYQ